jgi:hypothetical protein
MITRSGEVVLCTFHLDLVKLLLNVLHKANIEDSSRWITADLIPHHHPKAVGRVLATTMDKGLE